MGYEPLDYQDLLKEKRNFAGQSKGRVSFFCMDGKYAGVRKLQQYMNWRTYKKRPETDGNN